MTLNLKVYEESQAPPAKKQAALRLEAVIGGYILVSLVDATTGELLKYLFTIEDDGKLRRPVRARPSADYADTGIAYDEQGRIKLDEDNTPDARDGEIERLRARIAALEAEAT